MRICHVASGDVWGGAERVISLLVEGIQKLGEHHVEGILFNEGQLSKIMKASAIDVQVLSESEHSFWQLCQKFRRILMVSAGTEGQYDILHVHRYKELLLVLLASFPRLPRIIYTIHGFEPWPKIRLKEALRIWGCVILARLCGVLIVVVSTELERRLARVVGRSCVRRIGNPMPTIVPINVAVDCRHRYGWPSSKKIVGFVGRLEYVKGPDLFLELAGRIHDDNIGFVVLGWGTMGEKLVKQGESRLLESRVRFLGHVQDPLSYMREMDVLVMTSRHEGFPMAVVEAATLGIPVVAFDVGGIRDVMTESLGTRIVPFGDMELLTKEVVSVLGENEAREATQEWGRTLRAQFGLPKVIEQYVNLYRTISEELSPTR